MIVNLWQQRINDVLTCNTNMKRVYENSIDVVLESARFFSPWDYTDGSVLYKSQYSVCNIWSLGIDVAQL